MTKVLDYLDRRLLCPSYGLSSRPEGEILDRKIRHIIHKISRFARIAFLQSIRSRAGLENTLNNRFPSSRI